MTIQEKYLDQYLKNLPEVSTTLADEHQVISTKGPDQKSMDYEFLRKKGIEYAQSLSGKIWTDYNEHDPGVTILEQLCFALTDLGYRTNFSIEDILFSKRSPEEASTNNAFFDSKEILPCAPLSINDYRKLLIDRIPYVKNVWLETDTTNLHGFKGLYNVKLQLWDNLDADKKKETIEQTYQLLNANRNLCNDFNSIQILETDKIGIWADISIKPNAIGEVVFARIIYELENFLNPVVNFHSREDLQAEGQSVQETLDGPLLMNGLIKTEELKPLRSAIYISSLIEVITKVEGVEEVKNLRIHLDGVELEDNVIAFAEGRHPVLDEALYQIGPKESGIRMHRGDVKIEIDLGRVQQLLNIPLAKDRKNFNLLVESQALEQQVNKNLKDIETYTSLQHYFPQVYGIGAFGIPLNSDTRRIAQARQLKAYLCLFEQVLSNYLAQLANIRYLFSIEDNVDCTYFYQLPKNIPDFELLLKKQTISRTLGFLKSKTDQSDPFFDRRNRFLDHLLARFGERFNDDFLLKSNEEIGEGKDGKTMQQALVKSKAKFLRNYPQLSINRGKGLNYAQPSWDTDNVAGFKQKLCLLLNIENHRDRRLTALENFGGFSMKAPKVDFLDDDYGFVPIKMNLSEMLYYGTHQYRYKIDQDEDTGVYQVHFRTKSGEYRLIYRAEGFERCEIAIEELVDRFQQINAESEGFFVIENILLRPKAETLWNLVLTNESGQPFLESIENKSHEEQEDLVFNLLILGANRDNYEIRKVNEDYLIILKDSSEQPVMVSIERYSLDNAIQAIENINHLLNRIKLDDPLAINNLLRFEEEESKGINFLNQFYSNRLTIVLPAWTARFQNEDFRSNFEHLVRLNIPVHLAVDFHWLSFKDLQEFETVYQLWLEEKTKSNQITKKLDEFSFQVTELLLKQINKKKTNKTVDTPKTRGTNKQKAVIGRFYVFKNDQLQIIEGIGPKVEAVLKANGIQYWEDLANSSFEKLKYILDGAGSIYRIQRYENWSDQAWLAQRGEWNKLIAYQRLLATGVATNDTSELPSKVEKMIIETLGPEIKEDDLKIIYGIGRKVEIILKSGGITNLKKLAEADLNELKNLLSIANIKSHFIDPSTWAKQAQMVLDEKIDELWLYQKSLKATRDMLS